MSDKPIIFSAPMVRALLAGNKTQTRRVIKHQPWLQEGYWWWYGPNGVFRFSDDKGNIDQEQFDQMTNCQRYEVGDRLWVKEAVRHAYPRRMFKDAFVYRADAPKSLGMDEYSDRHEWRSPLFMHKKISRLTLTVTDVRVQRLQDISIEDAKAEGVFITEAQHAQQGEVAPRLAYAGLWDDINGDGSWAQNPWIAAYTFTVQRGNIDRVAT